MNSNQSGKASTILSIAMAGIVISGVIIFILMLGQSTNKETEVILTDESLEIKGMFGVTYSLDAITSIELKESIPEIGKKTNGSGLGDVRKGSFEVEGLGVCQLYILSSKGPFIYIKVEGKYVIINYKDSTKTEQLYQDLNEQWKK